MAGAAPTGARTLITNACHIHTHLIPHLGHLTLYELKTSHVNTMIEAIILRATHIREVRTSTHPTVRNSMRGQRPTGPATCQRVRDTLRNAVNDALADGLIRTNPARTVKVPSGSPGAAAGLDPERVDAWHDTGRIMVWTAQQTGEFLDHATTEDPYIYPLLHLIAYRRLRRGEVVGLREDDVALDRAQLTVTQQIVNLGTALHRKPPKSRAGHRTSA